MLDSEDMNFKYAPHMFVLLVMFSAIFSWLERTFFPKKAQCHPVARAERVNYKKAKAILQVNELIGVLNFLEICRHRMIFAPKNRNYCFPKEPRHCHHCSLLFRNFAVPGYVQDVYMRTMELLQSILINKGYLLLTKQYGDYLTYVRRPDGSRFWTLHCHHRNSIVEKGFTRAKQILLNEKMVHCNDCFFRHVECFSSAAAQEEFIKARLKQVSEPEKVKLGRIVLGEDYVPDHSFRNRERKRRRQLSHMELENTLLSRQNNTSRYRRNSTGQIKPRFGF